LAAAAAFLERAVALTPESSGRAERALAAAQIQLQAGAFEGALRLLGHAEAGPLDECRRAQADLLRAQVAYAQRRSSDAPALLLRAARQLEPLAATLARATYRDALTAASWADSSAGGVGVLEVAQAVEAATTQERPSRADLLLQGVARQCTECFAAGVPMLRQALAAIRHGELRGEEQLEWSIITTRAAVDLWDDESWYVMASRYVELARATGALPMLQFALDNRIIADAFAGALPAGSTRMEELHAICQVTGSELPAYGPLALAAWSGREADASKLIAATTREALARGDTQALSAAQWAAAVLHNSLGRYEGALAAAERAVDDQQVGFSGWSLAELVLAAARSGDLERAADALQQLAARARDCGSDWALGIEARSRALLTDGEIAERLYLEAIERLERRHVRVELARAHLLYGEWLRRERRRIDAREQLRTAKEMFTAMGAEALADCAARELLATGERVRKRSVETRDELTAQEAQIARLARDGLSNPEIGAQLFISPRTVEWHLRKVFMKLGISSRRELRGALPQTGRAA
jgi:DNA-binding CsgD family transcriptional regulator